MGSISAHAGAEPLPNLNQSSRKGLLSDLPAPPLSFSTVTSCVLSAACLRADIFT